MISLRALSTEDLPKTLEWHNQEEIRNFYLDHPFPVNQEMEKRWYDKILTSNFPTTVFGIEEDKKKELIGITVLRNIDLINRTVDFAIFIGNKTANGKGYAVEATKKTVDFAFLHLGLNRISVQVLENNALAIKLYKKIGFIQEGVLRKAVYKNGVFLNQLFYGLLKEDYYG